jgi:hypothetical protein
MAYRFNQFNTALTAFFKLFNGQLKEFDLLETAKNRMK